MVHSEEEVKVEEEEDTVLLNEAMVDIRLDEPLMGEDDLSTAPTT